MQIEHGEALLHIETRMTKEDKLMSQGERMRLNETWSGRLEII